MTVLFSLFIEYFLFPIIAIIFIFAIKTIYIPKDKINTEHIIHLGVELLFNFAFCILFFALGFHLHSKESGEDSEFVIMCIIISFIFLIYATLVYIGINQFTEDIKLKIKTILFSIILFATTLFILIFVGNEKLNHKSTVSTFWGAIIILISVILTVTIFYNYYLYSIKKKSAAIFNKYVSSYFLTKGNKFDQAIKGYLQIIKNSPENDPILISTNYFLFDAYQKKPSPDLTKSMKYLENLISLLENKEINKEEVSIVQSFIYKADLLKKMGRETESDSIWEYLKYRFPNNKYLQIKIKKQHPYKH